MYHPRMRSKPFSLPDSGPLLGVLYVLLWLALLPTQQPYWMLPFGLRFAALLIVPVRQWFWLLGLELAATVILDLRSGLPMGWETFVIGDLPEPLVMATGLWLLRRVNLHASLRDPEEATRLLLSAVLVVGAVAATDAVLLALLHQSAAPAAMVRALGRELLGNYLGVLLVAPLSIMLLRARPNRKMVASLVMDGLLVMLPAMALLLMLSEHAAPQPEFARVLSLAPVLFFAFRHGWRGATLAMLITSLGMTLVDVHLGHTPSTAAAYLFLAVAGTGALMLGSATDALRRSRERVAEP